MQELTQNHLKEVLRYNPDTGVFTWRGRPGGPVWWDGKHKGKPAGNKHRNGYINIKVLGRHYPAHHLAWLYVHGRFPTEQIDHKNHHRDDNRLRNLREVSNAENLRNKTRYINSNRVVGVRWHSTKKKWEARMQVEGVYVHLGCYVDWFEAVCARLSANNRYDFHPNHGR